MDPGDWIFYGLLAFSAIASVVKAVKKKDTSGQDDPKAVPPKSNDAEQWIKTILEETKKVAQMNEDDDYIPRNPKPSVSPQAPGTKPVWYPQSSATQQASQTTSSSKSPYWASQEAKSSETRTSPEQFHRNNQSTEHFRRTNQSPEQFTRSHQGLEDTSAIEGFNNRKTQISSPVVPNVDSTVVSSGLLFSPLTPADDLKEADKVRKAIVYGEIMRPKF